MPNLNFEIGMSKGYLMDNFFFKVIVNFVFKVIHGYLIDIPKTRKKLSKLSVFQMKILAISLSGFRGYQNEQSKREK